MSITKEIEFQLAGQDAVLKPSLKAARAVSRLAGGFNGVYQRLVSSDFDVIAAVIKAGIIAPKLSTDDLEQAVYETGTAKLIEPCAKFVRLLENGGRDDDAETEKEQPGNG